MGLISRTGSIPVSGTINPELYIAGWSSLVARRAHNPKVAWFKSRPRNHVGMDFAPFRFFYYIKKSVIRAVIPPLSPKAKAKPSLFGSFAAFFAVYSSSVFTQNGTLRAALGDYCALRRFSCRFSIYRIFTARSVNCLITFFV